MLHDCVFNLLSFYLFSSGATHDHFPICPSGTFDHRLKHINTLQRSPAYANYDGHG